MNVEYRMEKGTLGQGVDNTFCTKVPFLYLLEKDAILVPGRSQVRNVIPQDPADPMFLSCALEARAEVIISGDRHLLSLKEFEGIPIIPAGRFLKRLAEQRMP